ncbi:hypothetical protein [Armatimonas rosea]|uniref:Uncharacterized protein n=1 Tax=Armatimonas rosea TaxID=685828 RepID=A0A7W9W7X0_ARMRO|nr:hypothetical protein [Armatimonas rosea]MBB6052128.1 hypothetical protein [Armatimonas rosea]
MRLPRGPFFLFLLLLAGCGGGGGSDDPGASSVVAARATLAADSAPEVLVQWAAPLDISAQRIVEYHVFRDGNRVGAVDRDGRSFRDTTAEGAFSYQEASGTALTPRTGNHSAIRPGKRVRYQVRVLFQRIETSGATSYAETTLNEPGVATTALVRPALSSATPQASEALLRFPKLDGANQYQAELSAYPDFRSKTVRGPVLVTSGEGLITIPWPADSTPGSTVYCRIGARATSDASPPFTTDPNGDDYIYSVAQTIVRP